MKTGLKGWVRRGGLEGGVWTGGCGRGDGWVRGPYLWRRICPLIVGCLLGACLGERLDG